MAQLPLPRIAALGALLVAFLIQTAVADDRFSRQVNFDIAAQSVEAALLEFSKQADVQVMVGTLSLNGQKTEGVKGKLSVTQALEQLLKDTGLEYEAKGNTVTVKSVKNARAGAVVMPLADGLRLASSDARGEAATRSTLPADEEPTVETLDEVLVTGSRLRTRETQPAVTIFDRAKIDSLGVSTVPDVLKYVTQTPYRRGEAFNSAGAQFVELRGLGVATTLVLINGRRTVASAQNLTQNAFDLNSIPLSAVDRIEVLSDSASAVYGADAIGGVINVILKDKIDQPQVDLNYGTAEGGADERRASASLGYSQERVRASLILDYFDRDALLGAERDRWSNQDHRHLGGGDDRDTIASPGNVYSLTGANLPGLPAPFAGVPANSSGLLTSADFLATAGIENNDSLLRYWSIVPDTRRRSVAGFLDVDLGADVSAFAELLYTDADVTLQSEPASLFFWLVPATNAFNPFGEDVLVNYLFSTLPPREVEYQSEMTRAVAGLKGEIGDWDWEVSYLRSNERARHQLKGDIDLSAVDAALASSDSDTALNLFSSGVPGSAELLDSLRSPDSRSSYESVGDQGAAVLRGSPLSFAAGQVQIAVGGEWRKEKMEFNDTVSIQVSRDVSAAYAEVLVPLVDPGFGWPAVERLSLNVAGRYDHYDDFGGTFNPEYSLSWTPVSDLTVQVSYGTGFRAPSLYELYAPRNEFPFIIGDPGRNGENAALTLVTGGNPALDPIKSSSYSVGFIWSPSTLPALNAKAAYWRVDLEDRVASLAPQVILANEDLFPERVVRAAPSPGDIAAGLPGPLQVLDISQTNFGSLHTHGVDTTLSYVFQTGLGEFTPSLSATWVGEYASTDVPGEAAVDRLSVASFLGTIPRWKGVGSITWSRSAFSLSLTGRYVDSYADAQFFAGKTGRDVPSQTLVDVQGVVDFDRFQLTSRSFLAGVKLTAGIVNVFDKEPPFSEINLQFGFDGSQGDLRQRFSYMRLTKAF